MYVRPRIPKMNFQGQEFQQLKTERQTDTTGRILSCIRMDVFYHPHSRVVKIYANDVVGSVKNRGLAS